MRIENPHRFIKYITTVFLGIILLQASPSLAQGVSAEMDEEMRKRAEKIVRDYVRGLNLIADNPKENQWIDADINTLINNYFWDENVRVLNDLPRREGEDSVYTQSRDRIRDYLNNLAYLYQDGSRFTYSFARENVREVCQIEEVRNNNGVQETKQYLEVKVEVLKRFEGEHFLDKGTVLHQDSIDIFVRFPIVQNYPEVRPGEGKIIRITPFEPFEGCEQKDREGGEKEQSLGSFEQDLLRRRAELFVEDYAVTLDMIGNPELNEMYNVRDYFESEKTEVVNDLLDQIMLEKFTASDYLSNIETWFQQGIRFKFTTVNAIKDLDLQKEYVGVLVEVNRVYTVAPKNYRNRQKLLVHVRFPFDENGNIKAERATPRIYKIEGKPQRSNPLNYWSVGLQLNAMNYFGDLNPVNQWSSTNPSFTRPNFGFHISKKLSPRLQLRLGYTTGTLQGDDFESANPRDENRYRYIRNLHFRNNIQELSLTATYDFAHNRGQFYRRNRINPYVFGGFAIIRHNPQARVPTELGAEWIDLQPLGTEGQGREGYDNPYSLYQPAIPFGLGVRIRITERFDLGIEVGSRLLFFDYIDDVSTNYPDMADLSDNPLAAIMSNRTLEPTAARSGTNRQEELNRLIDELNGYLTYVGSDGRFYETFNGYGRRGEQRGNPKNNDFYVVGGFHLTYLINVGRGRYSSSERKSMNYKFR